MDNSVMSDAWIHPLGRTPEHVTMLMLGASKATYAELLAVHHDGLAQPDTEVWTCNAGFRIWRHDLLFVMDDMVREAHKWPRYGHDLAPHDRPIMTSTVYPEFPSAVAYPYELVCRALGIHGRMRYFRNSLPFMIAYALALGVSRIAIYGADYWHPDTTARERDLANAEWWLGFAMANGMSIDIPSTSSLMRSNEPLTTYGYRLDPALTMDRRPKEDKLRRDVEGTSMGKTPLSKHIEGERKPSNDEQNRRTRDSLLWRLPVAGVLPCDD